MSERTPSSMEFLPAEGEVVRVMERLFEGGQFSEIKRIEKDGILERLVFEGINSEGDRMLYDYRQGVIDVVFHDKEGIPCGGYNAAEYVQGTWKI